MSTAKRIVIGRSAALDGGGVARVMECWARVLADAGREVTVVTLESSSARELPARNRLHSIAVPSRATGRAGRTYGAARVVAQAIADLHGRAPVDLVITHDPFLTCAQRTATPGVPLLATFHSPLVEENRLNNWVYAPTFGRRATYPLTRVLAGRVECRALMACDAAHTLSDYTRGLLTRLHGRAARRTEFHRIPGSYDDARFIPAADRAAVRRALGSSPGETVLLTVRRLVPRTGVERVVRAARELRTSHPGARFLIGGSGVLEPALRRQIEAADCGDRVELLGFIAEEKLAAYYQAADAFLMPTRELECFGLPVIEAMACGCPSLVTPVGGPAEVCADLPGWVAEHNSGEAFTALVRRFLDGAVPRAADLAGRARRLYSDAALAPSIIRVVDRVAER